MTKEWQKVDVNDVWNFKNEDGTYSLKKDDEIEGILEEVKNDVGPNASNLYTLKMEDKKRVSVWGTSILDTRLKNVEIGEAVKIIYLGEFEGSKSGRSYHSFDVFHKEAEEPLEEIQEEDGEKESGEDGKKENESSANEGEE